MIQFKKSQISFPLTAVAVLLASNFALAKARGPSPEVLLNSPGAKEFMAEEVESWGRSIEHKHASIHHQQVVNGGFVLRGIPSAAQRFNRGKLIACQTKPVAGTFAAVRKACDVEHPIYIPLSLAGQEQITALPAGSYILGFENSVYPGFIYVNPGRATVIDLHQIPIPAEGAVKIFRDLTTNHEQSKLYFTTYTLGESLFSLAAWDFGDLYVKPNGIEDGARSFNYDICERAKLPEMTVKASRICRAWNQGSFMSLMELFDFEPLSSKDRKTGKVSLIKNSVGAFRQWEVKRQGRPYGYRVSRLLVAKRTSSAAAQHVNVLPGRYMVEVVDGNGNVTLESVAPIGPVDPSNNLVMNVGWLPQPVALKLEGKTVSAAPPSDGGDLDAAIYSPEDDEGEFINPNETCTSAKMWRTEWRAYCHSDKTEGCDRSTAQLCEPTFDIP